MLLKPKLTNLKKSFALLVLICLALATYSCGALTQQGQNAKASFLSVTPFGSILGHISAISCNLQMSSCLLAGSTSYGSNALAYKVVIGNKNLAEINLPHNAVALNSISCLRYPTCYFAGVSSNKIITIPAVYKFNGSSFNTEMSWNVFGGANYIYCPTNFRCLTVGTANAFSYTNNAFATSTPILLPANLRQEGPADCFLNTCYSTASEASILSTQTSLVGIVSNDYFATTKIFNLPPDFLFTTSIKCASASSCFFVGKTPANRVIVSYSPNSGKSFKSFVLQGNITSLDDFTCSPNSYCAGIAMDKSDQVSVISINENTLSYFLTPLNGAKDFAPTAIYCNNSLNCLASVAGITGEYSSLVAFDLKDALKIARRLKVSTGSLKYNYPNLKGISVMVTGDSVASTIQDAMGDLQNYYKAHIDPDLGIGLGCGLIPKTNSACPYWDKPYIYAIKSKPNVVFVEVGLWDLSGSDINDSFKSFLNKSFDGLWEARYRSILNQIKKSGSTPIAISLLYTQSFNNGGLESFIANTKLVNIANNLIKQAVGQVPGSKFANLNEYLYPAGKFSYFVDGIIIRPDFRHFGPEGGLLIAPYLYKFLES